MRLCVIPARGGSKRIPRKNIRLFRGKPIISWSIQAALSSKCVDRIIVSTDDIEIAAVAKECGAELPFIRPAYLSDDFTGTKEVINHAIDALSIDLSSSDQICCLYATAPFTSELDIINGLSLLNTSRSGSVVFPATTYPFPIQRAIYLDAQGYSLESDPKYSSMRSQDLREADHDAGQFYWATVYGWKNSGNLFARGRPLLLPRYRVKILTLKGGNMQVMHSVWRSLI